MNLIDLAQACMDHWDFAALPVNVRARSITEEQELRDALFELFFPGTPLEVIYIWRTTG